jgi:hypothetical protein
MSIVNWFSFLSSCILSVVCYTLCCSSSLVYFLFPFTLAFSLLTFLPLLIVSLLSCSFSKHFCLTLFLIVLSTVSFSLVSCLEPLSPFSFPFVSFIFRVVSWLLILSLASRLVSALSSLHSNLRSLIARTSYLISYIWLFISDLLFLFFRQ